MQAAYDNDLMALVGMRRDDVYDMDHAFNIARIQMYRDHPGTAGVACYGRAQLDRTTGNIWLYGGRNICLKFTM